jgi:hypothetical protein
VRFNPFRLRLQIKDLVVGGGPGDQQPLLQVGEIGTELSLRSIVRLAPVIAKLQVNTLRAHLVRLGANRFNFSDIIERLAARPRDAEAEPARFAVYNIELNDGAIAVDDRVVGKQHQVTGMRIGIPFISSLPSDVEVEVQPAFSALVNQSPLKIDGETRPFHESLETDVALRFTAIDLPTYVGYVPFPLQFSVPKGQLDTDLQVKFRQAVEATKEHAAEPARLLVTGSVKVRDFALQPKDMAAPLLQWQQLDVDLDTIALLRRTARIRSVMLQAPGVNAIRREDGSIAGMAALRPPESQAAGPGTSQAAFAVDIAQIRVGDGSVDFSDETVDLKRRLQGIELAVDGVSTRQGAAPAKFELSAATDDKTELRADGTVTPTPLAASANVSVAGLQVAGLEPYAREVLHARIGGRVDASGTVKVAAAGDTPQVQLENGRVVGTDLRVDGTVANSARLRVPNVEVEGVAADLQRREIRVAMVTTRNASSYAVRRPDGSIDWRTIAVATLKAGQRDPTPEWKVQVDQVEVIASRIEFTDRMFEPPATLEVQSINASLRQLSNDLSVASTVIARARVGGGTARVAGWVRPQPLQTELKLDVQNVDVTVARAYLAPHTQAVLASAAAWADGTLNADLSGERPAIRYDGGARVTNFAALNPGGESELARWQVLALDGVKVDTAAAPPRIGIDKVELSDFYARAILSEQGQLNLVQVLRPAQPAPADGTARSEDKVPVAEAAAKTAATAAVPKERHTTPLPFDVRIGEIEFLRGNVNFTDYFVKPNYTANLTDLTGSVGELASSAAVMADVSVRGHVDGDAPVEITGKVNPLASELALDIRASAKGVELPRATPYSVKYAGYPIIKGKLSMDVEYKVADSKLAADNHLFLDQLTFGERVESPTATKLPVLLAVSLLKDRNGQIDINLPISGSLDDPQFSIGGIIIRVIVNLLTKAITAPFTLLAAAFGGGADLGHVEFAPGSATVGEAEQKKLQTLAKALNDRPAVRLDVAGRAVAAIDAEPLRRTMFDELLRNAKLREQVRAGEKVDPATVKIDPAERDRLIGVVYGERKIPDKPRNFLGIAKTIPAADMEKLILSTIEIDDSNLRRLANERATSVRNQLATQGKVPMERMFLVAPELTDKSGDAKSGEARSGDAKLPPTRVDFSLK